MISVIIPAHNEAKVIGRCLSSLMAGARPGELEVIVVCNGCADATADVARAVGGAVKVIETDIASKIHAINLGDAAALAFPRFVVDADVVTTIDSVRCIAQHLHNGRTLAAAPSIRLDLDGASWAVRAFYDIDRRLPSHQEGIGGSGVYALSEQGRGRFDQFPDITADDAFVRRQFTPAERQTVADAWSIVTPPKTLSGVIKIKSRSHYGNYEIAERFPHLTANKGRSNRAALLAMLLRPGLWPALAVYFYVKIRARLRARWQFRMKSQNVWERDETSREALPPVTWADAPAPAASDPTAAEALSLSAAKSK